jgi:hypothetical protein
MDNGPTLAVPDPEAVTAPAALAAADPDPDPDPDTDADADADADDDPDADEASVARAPARGTGASRNIFIRTTQTTRPAAPKNMNGARHPISSAAMPDSNAPSPAPAKTPV